MFVSQHDGLNLPWACFLYLDFSIGGDLTNFEFCFAMKYKEMWSVNLHFIHSPCEW